MGDNAKRSLAVAAVHSALDVLLAKQMLGMDEAKRFGLAAGSEYFSSTVLQYWPTVGHEMRPAISGALYAGANMLLKVDGLPLIYQVLYQAGASYLVPKVFSP